MMGPPGTGKSMLAQRLNTLLPPMDEEEALQTLSLHSIGNQAIDLDHWRRRPYRSPHHTVSGVALVGGGCDFYRGCLQHKKSCYNSFRLKTIYPSGRD